MGFYINGHNTSIRVNGGAGADNVYEFSAPSDPTINATLIETFMGANIIEFSSADFPNTQTLRYCLMPTGTTYSGIKYYISDSTVCTVIGNPTINNNIVTGFSANNYLSVPYSNNSYVFYIKTASDITTRQVLFYDVANGQPRLFIENGKLCGTNMSNPSNVLTGPTIQANSFYIISFNHTYSSRSNNTYSQSNTVLYKNIETDDIYYGLDHASSLTYGLPYSTTVSTISSTYYIGSSGSGYPFKGEFYLDYLFASTATMFSNRNTIIWNAVLGRLNSAVLSGCLYPNYDSGVSTEYKDFYNTSNIVLTENNNYLDYTKAGLTTINTHTAWTNLCGSSWYASPQLKNITLNLLDTEENILQNASVYVSFYDTNMTYITATNCTSTSILGIPVNTKYIEISSLDSVTAADHKLPDNCTFDISVLNILNVQLEDVAANTINCIPATATINVDFYENMWSDWPEHYTGTGQVIVPYSAEGYMNISASNTGYYDYDISNIETTGQTINIELEQYPTSWSEAASLLNTKCAGGAYNSNAPKFYFQVKGTLSKGTEVEIFHDSNNNYLKLKRGTDDYMWLNINGNSIKCNTYSWTSYVESDNANWVSNNINNGYHTYFYVNQARFSCRNMSSSWSANAYDKPVWFTNWTGTITVNPNLFESSGTFSIKDVGFIQNENINVSTSPQTFILKYTNS